MNNVLNILLLIIKRNLKILMQCCLADYNLSLWFFNLAAEWLIYRDNAKSLILIWLGTGHKIIYQTNNRFLVLITSDFNFV